MSDHYYNEIDPYCAAWLQNLMDAGHIPAGRIDTRSIEDVRPDELRGYVQCHFFAGIGGWAYALALAGWPADRPVWTGSCPCQPFSQAGEGNGFADKRDLWPAFNHLITQCQPDEVLGEQVAGPDGIIWLDRLFADMDAKDYACAAGNIPAAGVGAQQIRQRIYWCAHSLRSGRQGHQQRNRISFAETSSLAKFGASFAHARRAMAGDYSGICLDDGVSVAVERCAAKGYGNAIVPQVAAAFIESYCEARDLMTMHTQEQAA